MIQACIKLNISVHNFPVSPFSGYLLQPLDKICLNICPGILKEIIQNRKKMSIVIVIVNHFLVSLFSWKLL